MKKLYLDNMIYAYLLQGRYKIKTEDLAQLKSEYSFLLSFTNCYELAPLIPNQPRLVNALRSCKLLFLPMVHHLQMEELKKYIYDKYFGLSYKPLLICEYISEVTTFLNPSHVIIGNHINDYLAIWNKQSLREFSDKLEKNWIVYVEQLFTKQRNLLDIQTKELVSVNTIKSLLNEISFPDDEACTIGKEVILDEVSLTYTTHPDYFPSLYLEDLFFEFRYRKGAKYPKQNDFRDIQHVVCGLTTSDIFVTTDKNILEFCDYASGFKLNLPTIKDTLNFLSCS